MKERKKEIHVGECVAVKLILNSDCRLQLACMEPESLVIARMKEETKRIKEKEEKIEEEKDGERED